ncbi:MAG: polysaccharide deacetylase family protein [Proteobacteria bacterium]|nr:polysaccharide deacetylase family protein [Pseudomonadota bacterium]MCH8323368.1 polysaccharide deacetylase family protein [Pseudomonadota bacterium]
MFQFLFKTKQVFFCLAFCLLGAGPGLAGTDVATVLISFDVEKYDDFDLLDQMNLDVPTTYFITGELAEMLPDRVGGLAVPGNTIGSHSFLHIDLTKLPDDEVKEQLETSKVLLENLANGQPVLWYRAPFLENDQRIINIAIQLGYKFTSSSFESQQELEGIDSIPISIGSWYLEAVDYVWFTEFNLENELALDYLINSFERSKVIERPLVILLHPSIISEHKEVLWDFIKYARENNGVFLSFTDYMQTLH